MSASIADPTDEYAAAEVLFQLRFGGEWSCERCGHRRCTHLRSRPRQFECNGCGTGTSVTAGTTLHRCRLPLTKVLRAAALLAGPVHSISARALAREIGVTVETAWSLAHRLREGFLRVPGLRFGPDVVLSSAGIRSRPPWRRRQESLLTMAALTVLWDRSRRVVVVTGRPDPHQLRRWVDQHADVERPLCGPFLLPDDPWRAGTRTHRGVSDRWLERYAQAFAGWHNARTEGRSGAADTLRLALRSARHPFRALRPRSPPIGDARWRTSFEELDAHSRAWSRS